MVDSEVIKTVNDLARSGDIERLWQPGTLSAIAAMTPANRAKVLKDIKFYLGRDHCPGLYAQAVKSQAQAIARRQPPRAPRAPRWPRWLRYATGAERAEYAARCRASSDAGDAPMA